MLLAVATLPVNARGLLLLSLARTAAGSMLTVHPVFLSSSPPSVAATYLAQTHVLIIYARPTKAMRAQNTHDQI